MHVFVPGQPRSSQQVSFIPETHSSAPEVMISSSVGLKLEEGSGGEKKVTNAASTMNPTRMKIMIVIFF